MKLAVNVTDDCHWRLYYCDVALRAQHLTSFSTDDLDRDFFNELSFACLINVLIEVKRISVRHHVPAIIITLHPELDQLNKPSDCLLVCDHAMVAEAPSQSRQADSPRPCRARPECPGFICLGS